MTYKVLFATGGTGGHIFPALATAAQIKTRWPDTDLLFAGGKLNSNRFFQEKGFYGEEIACAPFSYKNPLKMIAAVGSHLKGVNQSLALLRSFKPQVMVAFGSYYTLPLLLAACYLGIPYILHESNAVPGQVNRLFSRKAQMTACFLPEAMPRLHGKVVEAKMPLRWHYKDKIAKEEAAAYFGLNSRLTTLLIFGGSQGAKGINNCLSSMDQHYWSALSSSFQVIHLTGRGECVPSLQNHYSQASLTAKVLPFESRMDMAWSAADIAICRAGASTIAEAIEFHVPLILVPYPHSKEGHQDKNGEVFAAKIGGGAVIPEQELTPNAVAAILQKIINENILTNWQNNLRVYSEKQNFLPEFASLIIRTCL